jgi:N utilization substance protein A
MSFDLNAIITQIGKDKGIDRAVLVEAVESAMLSAAKKHFGHSLNLEVEINFSTGDIEVRQFRTVVSTVIDSGTQISLEEARRVYDPDSMIGDEFGQQLDTTVLGRIAAQTAKQVISQKVRDAERGVIYEEFKNSRGQLINGIVQRYDRGNVIVNLSRTEAILPRREQILRERYRQGDRVRSMILDIDRTARGPQIVLTRSHPEFLKKLFELEVPEMAEGVIEIKSVAREPGDRAKIAVHSNDSGVDPVGACVGVKGTRVQAVRQELRGERIDIVTWTPDEPSYVARSLAPAVVNRVVLDDSAHAMEVIVADDQLPLAIGRKGQNVKLASKLTGWKIDVISASVAEKESKRARASLDSIPGITFTEAELLFQEGFRSALEVSEVSCDEIASLHGMTDERAQQIIQSAKAHVEELRENGLLGEEVDPLETTDLTGLGIEKSLVQRLLENGFTGIQGLVERDEELSQLSGFTAEEIEAVRVAAEEFLRRSPLR